MTSKITARVLTYKLGSPSYGGSKQGKDCLDIFKPGLWQTGFFRCGKEWYHFQQELMVSKTIVKLFIT